jgi:hypothetical protein
MNTCKVDGVCRVQCEIRIGLHRGRVAVSVGVSNCQCIARWLPIQRRTRFLHLNQKTVGPGAGARCSEFEELRRPAVRGNKQLRFRRHQVFGRISRDRPGKPDDIGL